MSQDEHKRGQVMMMMMRRRRRKRLQQQQPQQQQLLLLLLLLQYTDDVDDDDDDCPAPAGVDLNLTVETAAVALTGRQPCAQHTRHSAQLFLTVPDQPALIKHRGGSDGTDSTDVADWSDRHVTVD